MAEFHSFVEVAAIIAPKKFHGKVKNYVHKIDQIDLKYGTDRKLLMANSSKMALEFKDLPAQPGAQDS